MEEKNPAPQISQGPLHIWRQLHQMVFSGKREITQTLTQALSSVYAGMQHTIFMSADPRLDHYFLLCSSAQLTIRESQGFV